MKKVSKSSQSSAPSRTLQSLWSWEQGLQSLPQNPGVYSFTSKNGSVLYVGKASNLKKRIQSYKRKKGHDPKTKLLLSSAVRLKYITLESEFQALLVEADLIRIHKPKYNIRLKDDKSPLYIVITSEIFPRILQYRKTDLPQSVKDEQIFGPFASAFQVRYILRSMRKVLPYCNASPQQKKQHKPCFYFHVGFCPGACVGKISVSEYQETIKNISFFLKGDQAKVKKYLATQMKINSENKEYEKAAILRDQLRLIEEVFQKKSQAIREDFYIQKVVLAQKELWKVLAPFIIKKKDIMPKKPFQRIEAYDISNIGNESATASMVVMIDGVPDKKEYRRFKIRYIKGQNDVQMIAEVVTRRLKHREWRFPDLIVIDGGKSQLQAARNALVSIGAHHKIPIIGLAKREEEIIIKKVSFHSIVLPKSSQALLLLMKARDEAHRYARSYHHLLRDLKMSSKFSKS